MNPQAAYDELIIKVREAWLLGSCSALLGWDEQTYMPPGGVEHRGNQMALLAGLHHERVSSPRIGELLAEVEGTSLGTDPTSVAAVNVREVRRTYNKNTRLPRTLVEELARTVSIAQQEWVIARAESSYARFEPWFEAILSLKRQEAECVGYARVPYDALLDDHEPGATTADIAAIFEALRAELLPFVAAIVASHRKPNVSVLHRTYPVDHQREFGEAMAAAVGFDFERGRLDTAAHPFCSGIGPGDCRLTTRYKPNQFCDSFFGILHEVGHGLYEQGLDSAHHGTPMGEAVSLGMHESQSRLWENAVGRSRAFWQYALPLAKKAFPDALHGVSLDDFHFAVNHVEPSLNRVQADEVTYNLHILIRFELEQALVAGDLSAADVPAAWNEKYNHYLGLTPPSDAEGCLQDIHWSAGLIGYFPTYTLGNLFAAQLFAKANDDLGDLSREFSRGEFRGLLSWLREHVHRQGHRYRAEKLVEHVTGQAPSHVPLMCALRDKYGNLYRVS